MLVFKKLIFALLLLLSLIILYQTSEPILSNIYLVFSFDWSILTQLIQFSLAVLSASLFFVIFATLAQDWKLILPIVFLGALSGFLILTTPTNFIISGGFLLSFVIVYLGLSGRLTTYLTFKPNALLIPPITQLSTLLLIIISVAFYFSADTKIKSTGLQIPDSLIDPVINMSLPQGQATIQDSMPQISPEQLQLLKQNPGLLKQYGLDPSILNEIDSQNPQAPGQNLIKNEVKKQIQNLVNPQIQFLAPALTVLFFFTLKFGLSTLSLILYPLVWFIFWILEKTGFTKFEVEQREVKKLVI